MNKEIFENQNLNNMSKCAGFISCSANSCPIDVNARFRKNFPNEELCRFTIKKKTKSQKGIKTLAPYSCLKVIPELNLKMLNKRNLRRWEKLKMINNHNES